MKCTMFKLFGTILGTTVCGGESFTLGSLKTSAKIYLSQHKCLQRGTDHTHAELIINRIIPDKVNMDKLCDIDLCDNHKINVYREVLIIPMQS